MISEGAVDRPGTDGRLHGVIVYNDTIDVGDWERRNLAGTVPSRWPYGLDLLEHLGMRLSVSAPRSLPKSLPSNTTVFGFDERVAHRVASTRTKHGSGVIWLLERAIGLKEQLRRIRTIRALRSMDVVWTYSAPLRPKVAEKLRMPDSKVVFVPLGIDEQFYTKEDYPASPMVLSVGNDRSRDTETLYRALTLVHESRPDVRLVVQTTDDRNCPSFIERYSRFRDHSELREFYRQASVVAIATHENLYTSGSTVALEVQAVGRPVVISGTPGMEDYVVDEMSGYLTPPGNAESMAARTLQILADPEFGARLGREGSERVRRANTTRHMAAAIHSALRSANA
jgi:glycosyltransferase involved in cell wall biosynthesis